MTYDVVRSQWIDYEEPLITIEKQELAIELAVEELHRYQSCNPSDTYFITIHGELQLKSEQNKINLS